MHPLDLVRNEGDGSLSASKAGYLVAGVLFTAKMAGILPASAPQDPMLWLVFMGTVGGYAVLLKLIARKYG